MKVGKLSLIVMTSSLFLIGSVQAEIKENVVSAMKSTCKYSLTAAKGIGAGVCTLSAFFGFRKAMRIIEKMYDGRRSSYDNPKMRMLEYTTFGILCSYVAYKLGKSFLRDFGILQAASRKKSEKVLP